MLSCTKKEVKDDAVIGSINIDLKYDKLELAIERVGSYTDSIHIIFASKTLYNCNLYKINYAYTSNDNHNNSYTLGNTYYEAGFCQWGNFPAVAKHKRTDLKLGNYAIEVTYDNKLYSGSLTVTATQYVVVNK
jgi:hypothetical protein